MTEEERQAKFAALEHCRKMGEKAYDAMYEAHSSRDANTCYRDAKEFFYEAIVLAGELGLREESSALNERLAHSKAVFRSQFTG